MPSTLPGGGRAHTPTLERLPAKDKPQLPEPLREEVTAAHACASSGALACWRPDNEGPGV